MEDAFGPGTYYSFINISFYTKFHFSFGRYLVIVGEWSLATDNCAMFL